MLTLVIEAPVWALLLPLAGGSPPRSGASAVRRAVVVGSVATLSTHAVLWFVAVPALRGAIGGSVVPVLVAEAGVCVVEGLAVAWWLRADRLTCLGAAVAANAASLVVGLVLW